MRRFLYLIFFVLTFNTGYAAVIKPEVKKHKEAIIKTDSSIVALRQFDKAALMRYSKQPEFQYKEIAQDISWWTRFWRWFWGSIARWFVHSGSRSSSVAWGLFWRIVEIILVALGVAALIFLIFKSQGIKINMFRRKSTTAPIPYSEFFENINEIDFDEQIENAIIKHNYRLAVRLLYLKCLKVLNNAGLIAWQIDKTNSTYINEIIDKEQRTAFKMLTQQFEYIWYGDFVIDARVYKSISSSFQNFNDGVA